MPLKRINVVFVLIILISSISLSLLANTVQASCTGCLCPGDPCRLCPLPPMTTDKVTEDDPETCKSLLPLELTNILLALINQQWLVLKMVVM